MSSDGMKQLNFPSVVLLSTAVALIKLNQKSSVACVPRQATP